MVVVAGCLIAQNNKILMVKEAEKAIYGQWNIPAGRVGEHELITDAAIREVYEETGCKVKLTGVLPISTVCLNNGNTVVRITFTADVIEENIKFDSNEILDVKWLDIDEVKSMTQEQLRAYDVSTKLIKDFEDKKIFSLEVFNSIKYIR